MAQPGEYYESIVTILLEDVERLLAGGAEPPTEPADRRAFVRAVFACLEGITHATKGLALSMFDDLGVTLTAAERALLLDEEYRLGDKGLAKVGVPYLKLKPHLSFAFGMVDRVIEPDVSVNHGSKEWSDLNVALERRNRLTHPRTASDLEVTDEELESTTHVFFWVMKKLTQSVLGSVLARRDDGSA